MFYGLLVEASSRAAVTREAEKTTLSYELDASWLLGLEAWVQLTVAVFVPKANAKPRKAALEQC